MSALSIIQNSHELRSAYAIWKSESSQPASEQGLAEYFLLWMAVVGRHHYHGIRIGVDYLNYITAPAPPFLTKIELFVATAARKIVHKSSQHSINDLHLWYYSEGIHLFNVVIFITGREIESLSQTIANDSGKDTGISLLDNIIHAASVAAKNNFDISRPDGRRDYEAWRVVQGEKTIPIWCRMPIPSLAKPWSTLESISEGHGPSHSAFVADREEQRCPGVNLIGFPSGVLGLGEDLRAFATIMRAAAVPHAIYNIELSEKHATSAPTDLKSFFIERPIFPINLFSIPLFETERMHLERGENLFSGRVNIANWAWELSTLPDYWSHAFDKVDEIWAMSYFLVDVYKSLTSKPVVYMPPYVNVERIEPFDRAHIGFREDDFVFLTMLDFNSFLARKNPEAVIRAFKSAFPRRHSTERLVIKTLNGHARPDRLNELLRICGDDSRIVIVDGDYTREAIHGLIAAADCFVSLHRAEGFGRVIAEAMLLKTAVIATNYSGNLTFFNNSNGFPIDYSMVRVERGDYPYMEGSFWAEPSFDDAVEKLRLLATRPDAVQGKTQRAQHTIAVNHGLGIVSNRVREQLSAHMPL
jgi:glycosyltransferase involved in cell wall biosynthesis